MIDMRDGTVFLKTVREKLEQKIRELDASIEEGRREVDQMHTYYWENYTEMDEYGYENYDNQQALLMQVSANTEASRQEARLLKLLDSPFFGRVDFVYEGDDEAEIFYIGLAGFSEEAGQSPLIYDWRAPVSSLFYDYDQGEASYEAPVGILSGRILEKWQYRIRGGKMIYQFASDIKIDDDVLRSELGSGGNARLKNIIRTIQKEQNAIIRNRKDRVLVIQGAAGSGKTSIALHRIAYLLYHDRKNLKSSNILILSPNGIFTDYISHVLPELGEENIREMSFDLFAYRELKGIIRDCEDRYDAIEQELKGGSLSEERLCKQSEAFMEEMEAFLLELEDSLMDFSEVSVKNYSMSESRMMKLFYEQFAQIPLLSRMNYIEEIFVDELETLRGRDMDEQEAAVLHDRFEAFYQTRDIYLLYSRFLESIGLSPLPEKAMEERFLAYEDVYPLLYMKHRLTEKRKDPSVKHLVVDEMQDYSLMQYRILQSMFDCRMTILGDRAQTMEGTVRDVLTFLPGVFGRDTHCLELKKCYRNTFEIASYACELSGIRDLELIDRHGKAVREESAVSFEAGADLIAEAILAQSPDYETTAVLTMTACEAALCQQLLTERLSGAGFDCAGKLMYLHRDSRRFQKGVTVTTFYLAKGLEFDNVYTLYPGGDDRPLIRQARYICATRAMHELVMVACGPDGPVPAEENFLTD